MTGYRYQALGPLLAGEGSRAFLGLAISEDNRAVPVVIIWVPEAAERDAAVLAKVKQETEHASKLEHPNIVTVLGFAELDEGHARVVEFADGESLRKVLEAGRLLPPPIAARVICDACTGAHYAHVAGNDDGSALVHGDLRPETLLVGYNGTTKVTGYGALAFAPREVGGQRVQGRQVHSAPEQIIGGRAALVLATDVYLLGLSLYECLTGVVPWSDQGDFFEHAVLTLPLPPPAPDSVPPALEAIVQRACAKKAADRYPTPLALREAIEAALPGGIASTEEVARFLETVFPQSHQLRADRRHTIDAGIADFVRRQWASPSAPVPPTPAPASATPSPPRPPPPPPSTTPRASMGPVSGSSASGSRVRPTSSPSGLRPPPPPMDDDDEPQRESGRSAPWLVVLAIFVGIIAAWWAWKKAHEPIPGVDPVPRATAPEPVRGVPTSSVTRAVDAGAASPSPVAEVPDAGAMRVSAVVDAGRAAEAPPADVLVSLQSTPNVELLLDGKPLGRTPWSAGSRQAERASPFRTRTSD